MDTTTAQLLKALALLAGLALFAWWQFRDLERERGARERRQREQQGARPAADAGPSTGDTRP